MKQAWDSNSAFGVLRSAIRIPRSSSRIPRSAIRIPRSSSPPAFTLIELAVVMLVIAILAVLTIEKITSLAPMRDRLAADELKVTLRYVRNMAVTRECMTRVNFTVVSNSYSVWVANTGGSFSPAADPVTQKTNWTVDIGERFPEVSLSSVNIGGGSTLYFSGTNGIPGYSTNAPLASNGTITFDSGLAVTIVKETGYVY